MAHGTYRDNSLFYNIIIDACKQETVDLSLGEEAKCIENSDTELSSSYFYFINNYIDVLNYKNSIIEFLYRIEISVQKNIYFMNNLNIIPSSVRTYNCFFFENIEESKSYLIEKNDVSQRRYSYDNPIFVKYSFLAKE